jgi:hypothetical protein
MTVEGQTELLDAIEEARARLVLALATGAREAADLATELGRLERILASSLLEERTVHCPGNGDRPVNEALRFRAPRRTNPNPGRPSSFPGKSGSSPSGERGLYG